MRSLFSRSGRRRLRALLSLTGGHEPQGFLIPYRHAAALRPDRNLPVQELFEHHAELAYSWLDRAAAELEILRPLLGPPPAPRFEQDWFPRLDGLMAFTMVAAHRPRRIIEIGSGHSTRFMAAAIRHYCLDCAFLAIDPAPRADIASLPIRRLPKLFDADCAGLTAELEADDILFIDSSHVAMPGSDVDLLLGQIVPSLRPGVLVHVHDIFLPEPYPDAWRWRGYNEQALVSALLLGGTLAPLVANRWLVDRQGPRLKSLGLDRLPLLPGAFETSLWTRRTEAGHRTL